MIIPREGKPYCNKCRRFCDSICWTSCEHYLSKCSTCKHFHDSEDDYCKDCGFTNDLWVDRYDHDQEGGNNGRTGLETDK